MKLCLEEIQKRHPGMDIIMGKSTPEDRGIRLNLPEMEIDRNASIDAAAEYLYGNRMAVTEKRPMGFPTCVFTFVLGAMGASSVWYLLL